MIRHYVVDGTTATAVQSVPYRSLLLACTATIIIVIITITIIIIISSSSSSSSISIITLIGFGRAVDSESLSIVHAMEGVSVTGNAATLVTAQRAHIVFV